MPTTGRNLHRSIAWGVALHLLLMPGSMVSASDLSRPKPPIAFTNVESERFAQTNPECTCRALGRLYALGSQVCLSGVNGTQLFRCGMDLNVTSWQSMSKPCPLS